MTQVTEQLRRLNSELIGRAVHYTTLKNLEKISVEGLLPKSKIASNNQKDLPAWTFEGYVFAIDEKEIRKWTENERLPKAMNRLAKHVRVEENERDNIKNLLLRRRNKLVELGIYLTNSDEIYVLDCFRLQGNLLDSLAHYFFGTRTNKTFRDYVSSRIPYSDYAGSYVLPELTIRNIIEPERIHLERIID